MKFVLTDFVFFCHGFSTTKNSIIHQHPPRPRLPTHQHPPPLIWFSGGECYSACVNYKRRFWNFWKLSSSFLEGSLKDSCSFLRFLTFLGNSTTPTQPRRNPITKPASRWAPRPNSSSSKAPNSLIHGLLINSPSMPSYIPRTSRVTEHWEHASWVPLCVIRRAETFRLQEGNSFQIVLPPGVSHISSIPRLQQSINAS